MLEELFKSECTITNDDKDLALQKILSYTKRHISTEEIHIIGLLIQNGATVKDASHIANALYRAFDVHIETFRNLMNVIIKAADNQLKGLLLLALYLKDRNPHPNRNLPHPSNISNITVLKGNHNEEYNSNRTMIEGANPGETDSDDAETDVMDVTSQSWDAEVLRFIKEIYLSGFNPRDFLRGSALPPVNMGRLVQALPHLLQLCPYVDQFTVAFTLLKVAMLFPLINVESKSTVKLLCDLLIALGYDIGEINDKAKCPRKFSKVFGFTEAAKKPRILTLQECSRLSIRRHLAEPNVLLGVEQLDLPKPMKRYILLQSHLDFEKYLTPL